MVKILHCRDAGFDCDAVVAGDSIDEIIAQVRPHARDVHGVTVDPTMEDQLRRIVSDQPAQS